MSTTRRFLLAVLATGALLLLAAPGALASGAPDEVVAIPVSFRVTNTNTSKAPCPADGAAYTVRGELIGPRAALKGGPSQVATLYYHGLDLGQFFWHFTAVPGYDYATEMARMGNVSLVVDRLGYGASDRSSGEKTCYGSQADVAHQIIGALRSGGYTAASPTAPRFGKVLLAGNGAEGYTVEAEAHSYQDIDGLLLFGFADTGATPLTFAEFGQLESLCQRGGERSDGTGGPSGYAFVAPRSEDFDQTFFDADPAVVRATRALQHRNPCGEPSSAFATGAVDQTSLSQVRVPVLLVAPDHDAQFSPQSQQQQRLLFTGTKDVTVVNQADTGSLVTLGRSAPAFRGTVAGWLRSHNFTVCAIRQAGSLRLRRPSHGRIVSAAVSVNGARLTGQRGRSLPAIAVPALPATGDLTVRVMTVSSTGVRTTSVRTYRDCGKSRPQVTTRTRTR